MHVIFEPILECKTKSVPHKMNIFNADVSL